MNEYSKTIYLSSEDREFQVNDAVFPMARSWPGRALGGGEGQGSVSGLPVHHW